MIFGLAGRPRSGKSYEAVVYHIIPAVKEGRKVITNIPLNIDKFKKIFGDKADLIEVR
ncbi:zonular occludens toxin domain-containing protein, partial [Vibrio sinaloensis]|uniref:zonular occludens toxin domain-containing protein n=1 Tax=Photobacterium sp. (strain ATCC 43367) TaxID=379097 RepID=UPI0035E7CD6A